MDAESYFDLFCKTCIRMDSDGFPHASAVKPPLRCHTSTGCTACKEASPDRRGWTHWLHCFAFQDPNDTKHFQTGKHHHFSLEWDISGPYRIVCPESWQSHNAHLVLSQLLFSQPQLVPCDSSPTRHQYLNPLNPRD